LEGSICGGGWHIMAGGVFTRREVFLEAGCRPFWHGGRCGLRVSHIIPWQLSIGILVARQQTQQAAASGSSIIVARQHTNTHMHGDQREELSLVPSLRPGVRSLHLRHLIGTPQVMTYQIPQLRTQSIAQSDHVIQDEVGALVHLANRLAL